MEETDELIALDAGSYRRLLQSAPSQQVAGGRTYDAVIVACALAGGADTLLTFNEAHFRSLAGGTIHIAVPTA